MHADHGLLIRASSFNRMFTPGRKELQITLQSFRFEDARLEVCYPNATYQLCSELYAAVTGLDIKNRAELSASVSP